MDNEKADPVRIEDAAAVLDAQPFSRLLGAELLAFAPEGTELALTLRDDLRQQFGFAHGGVIAYAADNALTFAGGTVLGPKIVSRGFTLDFVRPALGPRILAVARVVESSRRNAVCRCDVFNVEESGERTLVAIAQGTIARIEIEAA